MDVYLPPYGCILAQLLVVYHPSFRLHTSLAYACISAWLMVAHQPGLWLHTSPACGCVPREESYVLSKLWILDNKEIKELRKKKGHTRGLQQNIVTTHVFIDFSWGGWVGWTIKIT